MSQPARPRPPTRARRIRRALGFAVLLLLAVAVADWVVGRATAGGRTVTVRHTPTAAAASPDPTDPDPADQAPASPDPAAADTLRVLAWNIAHNRGDLSQGTMQNFRGGPDEVRVARLARIAAVIRAADADVVVLNEVDFDAVWSGGLDHAETLALAAGYPTRVEVRNFDYGALGLDFAFGNALLTRLPVDTARHVPIPPHSRLEALVIGAKTGAVVELTTAAGPVAVVPIHLEFRSEPTRLAAVPVLAALRDDAPPLVLAGDFNSTPPGWPGAGPVTALGALLDAGWSSPRAAGPPGAGELTFPSPDPRRAIDWVLAEAPLRVLEARVLDGAAELSDHMPVLAVVEVR